MVMRYRRTPQLVRLLHFLLEALSQVLLPGCDTTNCAVPGKGSHNNTIRTLERSLLAADTDGYADTERGTPRECAVRVLVRVTEIRVLRTHDNLSLTIQLSRCFRSELERDAWRFLPRVASR